MDINKIQPLGNRALVRIINDNAEQTTASGIVTVTNDMKRLIVEAEILALGPGETTSTGGFIPLDSVSVGDKILINRYAGDKTDSGVMGDKSLRIILETDMLAVLHE